MKIAEHVEKIKTESVRNTKRKEEQWRDDGKDEFRSGAFVMTFFAAIFVNMEFCFAKPGDSKVGVDKS